MKNAKIADSPSVTARAYLGGGCFWCLEAVFERIPGVIDVVSGYAGGAGKDPDYATVSTGLTGHAEIVEIEYDPAVTDYDRILDVFWKIHDPTTKDRQGADVGTQYRSIILVSGNEERQQVLRSMEKAQKLFRDRIVTEIKDLDRFYPAEDYHQNYFDKNPYAGYCRVVIAPKLEKLDLLFEDRP